MVEILGLEQMKENEFEGYKCSHTANKLFLGFTPEINLLFRP